MLSCDDDIIYFSRTENLDDNDFLEENGNLWTPEFGFRSKDLKQHRNGYPRAGIGSGAHLGLSVILNASISEFYCSSTSGLGFKTLLHSPNELPEVDYYGLGIANGFESRIVITPILSKASRAVRSMPMEIRQCLFESENPLSFYRLVIYLRCNFKLSANANENLIYFP